jgi:hypothetical protein
MPDFRVPRDTLQKIADYLSLRPYNEVANLISELVENSKEIKVDTEASE